MKIKKKIVQIIYFLINHKKKRKIFNQTYKCKLLSSKSFIFFTNQFNKDLRSSTKFFISEKTNKILQNEFDIFYVCSDALEDFVSQIQNYKKKFLLISGDSDRTISKNLSVYRTLNKNKKLLNWYSQNCINPNKKISQIPIGLDYISQFHDTHQFRLNVIRKDLLPEKYEKKLFDIIKNSKNLNDRKDLIFCNFHFSINSKDRVDCINNIDKNLCYFLKNKISFLENFKQQSKFKFVLAPQGAGIDTHRIWEAIFFGNIPIIKSSPLNKLYEDFPVLIVKSWKDITFKKLMFASKQFSNLSYSYEKLFINYWKAKILKKNIEIKKLKNYKIFKKYLLKK